MSVQRYKVGYYTDEWGMSSNTPCLLRDDNGYAVKFDDYALLKKQRNELLKALERAEAAMEICSDWMSEIEMPDGWTTTTDEKLKISAAIARVKGEQ